MPEPDPSALLAQSVVAAAWKWIADTGCLCAGDEVPETLAEHEQTCPGWLEHLMRLAADPDVLDNHYGYCTLRPDHPGPCAPRPAHELLCSAMEDIDREKGHVSPSTWGTLLAVAEALDHPQAGARLVHVEGSSTADGGDEGA